MDPVKRAELLHRHRALVRRIKARALDLSFIELDESPKALDGLERDMEEISRVLESLGYARERGVHTGDDIANAPDTTGEHLALTAAIAGLLEYRP